jgi:hypothetical protein
MHSGAHSKSLGGIVRVENIVWLSLRPVHEMFSFHGSLIILFPLVDCAACSLSIGKFHFWNDPNSSRPSHLHFWSKDSTFRKDSDFSMKEEMAPLPSCPWSRLQRKRTDRRKYCRSIRGIRWPWTTRKFLHDKDNSILFQLFDVVFATLLHYPRQSRGPVCEHIFQYDFRDFRDNLGYRKN